MAHAIAKLRHKFEPMPQARWCIMRESQAKHGVLWEKALWAVDAFGGEPSFHGRIAKTVNAYASNMVGKVEPVFVARPDLPLVNLQAGFVFDRDAVQVASDNLTAASGYLTSEKKDHPHILWAMADSTDSSVHTLLEHITQSGAEIVCMGAEGRGRLPRFFLGSFTETLILESPVPVLVINPRFNAGRGFREVIVASDFSATAYRAFRAALDHAEHWDVRILLVHCLDKHDQPEWDAIASHWMAEARNRNLECDLEVISLKGGLACSLIQEARKHFRGLLVLALESTLIGRVNRQLIRRSPMPVLVLPYVEEPPKKKEAFPSARVPIHAVLC